MILLVTTSCTHPLHTADRTSLSLASFNESDVDVSIQLETGMNGKHLLSATFTPPKGYHLYSKDIPPTGVDGLGRSTLVELTENSQMKSTSEIMESVKAQEPGFEPRELLVYPPGAVTLSLFVQLPPGAEWVNDTIRITYMACSERGCKAPVTGKIIQVRVPGVDAFTE